MDSLYDLYSRVYVSRNKNMISLNAMVRLNNGDERQKYMEEQLLHNGE